MVWWNISIFSWSYEILYISMHPYFDLMSIARIISCAKLSRAARCSDLFNCSDLRKCEPHAPGAQ